MITPEQHQPVLSVSTPDPDCTHVYMYVYPLRLPIHLVYQRQTNWLYFTALSKHRMWNELFLRKNGRLALGFRARREVILDRRLLR